MKPEDNNLRMSYKPLQPLDSIKSTWAKFFNMNRKDLYRSPTGPDPLISAANLLK